MILRLCRGRSSLIPLLVLAACFSGCASTDTTPLADGFRSYSSEANVLAQLHMSGLYFGWSEHLEEASTGAARPPHSVVYLSGPFQLDGIGGTLTLTFYNDRLMETRFATSRATDFIAVLRLKGANAPDANGQKIVSVGRTELRVDSTSNGQSVFTWSDPILEYERNDWVKHFN